MKLDYKPEIGSLPYRLLAWFEKNRDEELTYTDIVKKFDVQASKSIVPILESALAAQVLQRARDDEGRAVIKAGPRFDDWMQKKESEAMKAAAAAIKRSKASSRRPPVQPLPDIAAIPIRPYTVQPKFGGQKSSLGVIHQITSLIARLQPGTSVELDEAYCFTAGDALTRWRKAHPTHRLSLVKEGNGKISINRYPDQQPQPKKEAACW